MGPAGKTIGRAALVGGNPAFAENNIAVSSFEAYTNWLSQVANPTGVISPSGEDLNEVQLSQKSNVLGRLPGKWFDAYLRSLSAEPGSKSRLELLAEKWERNWPPGQKFNQMANGQPGFKGVSAGVLQFLAGFEQGDGFEDADITENTLTAQTLPGPISVMLPTIFKPSIGRQAIAAALPVLTRCIVKVMVAFQVGVGLPEVGAFVGVQRTRLLDLLSGFVGTGILLDVTFILTPRFGIHVSAT